MNLFLFIFQKRKNFLNRSILNSRKEDFFLINLFLFFSELPERGDPDTQWRGFPECCPLIQRNIPQGRAFIHSHSITVIHSYFQNVVLSYNEIFLKAEHSSISITFIHVSRILSTHTPKYSSRQSIHPSALLSFIHISWSP